MTDLVPRLTRSELAVLRELVRCDRANRKNGKEKFRHGDKTLADKIRYGGTAIIAARNGLREKVGLEWKRTGRTNIYRVPEYAHQVFEEQTRRKVSRADPQN